MVFLKISWDVNTCRNRLERFETVHFPDIILDDKKLRSPCKIKCVLLYSTRAVKKYRLSVPAKKNLQASSKEITTFDRFLLFGVPGTPHVMVMFLENKSKTKDVLKFSSQIRPGDDVYIVMPSVVSFIAPQTPEVKTDEPLVPCCPDEVQPLYQAILPPDDTKVENYVYFDFITTSLSVVSSCEDQVCTGVFCDGQMEAGACGCTMVSAQKKWAVSLKAICDELDANARTDITVRSHRTSFVLVHQDTLSWPLVNDFIDPFAIHEAVNNFVDLVNREQGFRVIGWFKPGSSEEGEMAETFSFHISYLMPSTPLTEEQLGACYHATRDEEPRQPPKKPRNLGEERKHLFKPVKLIVVLPGQMDSGEDLADLCSAKTV